MKRPPSPRMREIAAFYERGDMTADAVGARFGITHQAVSRALRKCGVDVKAIRAARPKAVPKVFQDDPEILSRIVQRHRELKNVSAVAREMGLPRDTVYSALRKAGIPTSVTPQERFWRQVDVGEPENCWLWIGRSVSHKGYGLMMVEARRRYAHHLVWMFTHGAIPDGKLVMHSCGVSLCCNPQHLRLGTDQDNVRDREIHRRYGRGPHSVKKILASSAASGL